MVQHIVAPVDGSPESWRGASAAISLARCTDAGITLLGVEFVEEERHPALERITRDLQYEHVDGLDIELEVRVAIDGVAQEIESVVERIPGSVVVMTSHGRGRSSALVGSVADDVLQRTFGPVLLIGPHVVDAPFSGPVLISVDGSEVSERAVPLGVAWAIELGLEPWVVNVVEADTTTPADVFESAYVANIAHEAQRASGHEVEFEEIHGRDPATAVAAYAARAGAAMIVASSHGRTGMSRLTLGSVCSGFVRHAHCPVLMIREPHLADRRGGATRTATAAGP